MAKMPDFVERVWNVKSERQFIASRRHAAVLLTKTFLRSAVTESNDESAVVGAAGNIMSPMYPDFGLERCPVAYSARSVRAKISIFARPTQWGSAVFPEHHFPAFPNQTLENTRTTDESWVIALADFNAGPFAESGNDLSREPEPRAGQNPSASFRVAYSQETHSSLVSVVPML